MVEDKIEQLLLESCNIMMGYAKDCNENYVLHNNSVNSTKKAPCCDWYHGVWQYLRVLNCVSAPQWHRDFYTKSFRSVYAEHRQKRPFKILICGAADYSMLHLLITALGDDKYLDIDILDICPTPLHICGWYAQNCHTAGINSAYKFLERRKRLYKFQINDKITVTTIQQSITLYNPTAYGGAEDAKYDLICTDAFLTRFSAQEVKSVLDKWAKILSENGKIVTTVRASGNIDDGGKLSLAQQSSDINKYCNKVTERYIKLDEEKRGKLKISIEDLRYMAFRYIERMKSNKLGTQEQIRARFANSRLKILDGMSEECAKTEGEIAQTDYFRIVAELPKRSKV